MNVSEEAKSGESGLFKVLYICFTDFLWITVCVMYSVKRKIKIKHYQPLSNGLFCFINSFPEAPLKISFTCSGFAAEKSLIENITPGFSQ